MQRIERYGVIALVLLLVTIASISFWEDGSATYAGDNSGNDGARLATAAVDRYEPPRVAETGRRSTSRGSLAVDPNLPERGKRNGTARGRTPGTIAGSDRSAIAGGGAPTRGGEAGRENLRNAGRGRLGGSLTPGFRTTTQGRAQDPEPREQAVPFPASLVQPRSTPAGAGAEHVGEREQLSRNLPAESVTPRLGSSAVVNAVYVVESGDTLGDISFQTLGTSKRWREIQALNGNVDPASLHVGQELRLPAGGVVPTARSTEKAAKAVHVVNGGGAPRSSQGRRYTVKPGDVLSTIAQRELGSARRWREIVAANPGLQPESLLIGSVLALPAGTNLPATSSTLLARAGLTPPKRNRVR